ncbi:Putative zinc-binding metallo-peptidase [Granulicatella balaenopterae]|uniref:Putative zinc-binding metallo-peptidase n=1 Tax=Granulicatella balaenopterae TaxID=137733 RepID=A0A1H9PDT7_9LACT|nr:putative zinc-binding metallopeptidase [Granulicatella balaenopterae]SER46344.1 Putative zinc-binding metallo-peptidase [Granulicatella balaenopterae]
MIKQVLGLIGIAVFAVGCQSQEVNHEQSTSETEAVTQATDNDPETNFLIFFEDKLGYDANELSDKEYQQLLTTFEKVDQLNQDDPSQSLEALQLEATAYQSLREKGYQIPMMSLVDVAESFQKELSTQDYQLLLESAVKDESQMTDEEYATMIEQIDQIIKPFGLSATEILDKTGGEDLQLALYRVEAGQLVKENLDTIANTTPDDAIEEEDQAIWQTVSKLYPAEYLAMITRFEVATDGYDGSLAYVYSLNNKDFTLSVDNCDLYGENGELTEDAKWTLIHELGHIISMNESQMAQKQADESDYQVEEGTFAKESYLAVYYDEFWRNMNQKDEEDESQVTKRYEDNPDSFISEYAATNPVEDFAETFAAFVTKDKPSGTTILDQKIQFFYRYPKLEKIRQELRDNLNKLG